MKLDVDDQDSDTCSQPFASHVHEIEQYKNNAFDILTPDGYAKAKQIKAEIASIDKEISNLNAEKNEKQALVEQYAGSIFGAKARIKREAKYRLEEIERKLAKLEKEKDSLQ